MDFYPRQEFSSLQIKASNSRTMIIYNQRTTEMAYLQEKIAFGDRTCSILMPGLGEITYPLRPFDQGDEGRGGSVSCPKVAVRKVAYSCDFCMLKLYAPKSYSSTLTPSGIRIFLINEWYGAGI